jgi:hypothetical protein
LGVIKGTQIFFLTSGQPTLPFGFEIGKIVKYAGLNFNQLDLIRGEKLARLLRIEPKPSAPKTPGHHANLTTKSPDAYRRFGGEKMDWLISHS